MAKPTEAEQQAINQVNQFNKAFTAAMQAFTDTFADVLLEESPTPIPGPDPISVLPQGGEGRTDLQLVWNEQFDRDLTNWRRGSRDKANGLQASPGYPNKEAEFYHPDQVTLMNSQLQLTAIKRYVKVVKVSENDPLKASFVKKAGTQADPDLFYWPYYSGTFPYQSGWASTGPDDNGWTSNPMWQPSPATREWKYGWIEASVKQPKGKGLWTAMWLLRSDKANRSEIDIFEMVDPSSKKIAMHIHGGTSDQDKWDWTKDTGPGKDIGVDLSEGFHTYAVDWSPDYVRWYIDGKLVQEFTDKAKIPDAMMYLIFNFAVGADGSWPGAPDSTVMFPQQMLVDYVRVWQKKS